MLTRTAEADWDGTLRAGRGELHMPHGHGAEPYSYRSRFTDGAEATSPEELIAAAHAGCFSMALSQRIEEAGYLPEHLHTRARVHMDRDQGGFHITAIDLETEGRVPGMDEPAFIAEAEAAKKGCPVSQALAVKEIRLSARLV